VIQNITLALIEFAQGSNLLLLSTGKTFYIVYKLRQHTPDYLLL